MDFERFFTAAKEMNINVEIFQFSKLQVYFQFLTEYNQKVNLTAITEEEDVFLLHFLDSLAAVHEIPQNASVCDVGTGAGFPGVVLKIFRPDIELTLVDSLNKRIVFLKELLGKLSVSATCVHCRAEDAARGDLRERFNVVVSRALAKLNTLYEYALPLVKVGGKFIAYKANCEDELAESAAVPQKLGGKLKKTEKLFLPVKEVNRTLVIVEKVSPTPKLYPRGKNKEREQPL